MNKQIESEIRYLRTKYFIVSSHKDINVVPYTNKHRIQVVLNFTRYEKLN